jgi:hypothetical protein
MARKSKASRGEAANFAPALTSTTKGSFMTEADRDNSPDVPPFPLTHHY